MGKVASILHKTVLGMQEPQSRAYSSSFEHLAAAVRAAPLRKIPISVDPIAGNTASTILPSPRQRQFSPSATPQCTVKETRHVSLEYDPITRRKVLNNYEILRDIGHGEHGKVKLARDLVHNDLVAIKVVSRKLKRDRQLRMRRPSNAPPNYRTHSDYEIRIRREIAIMKRCDHKYIVKLKEVLDDFSLFKIYLVLEYMDRGEIKWKRQHPIEVPRPLEQLSSASYTGPAHERFPCRTGGRRAFAGATGSASEDKDLLSNVFSPNLTFRQSRRIFRDVLLGLEYLHLQGIVHRDIKPANLLVSSNYVVKILDFGVSFASSLGFLDDGISFSDMDLAITVGTPAFFAPELCQTSSLAVTSTVESSSSRSAGADAPAATETLRASIPRVDHKIDIWAFGVTLYCLLFGRVPFNADNEFALFDVIVHQELEFPVSKEAFHSPQQVSDDEFELAKDLLRKMLDKDSLKRIDIPEIKQHPFVLMDLENDLEKLHELFFLNDEYIDSSAATAANAHKHTAGEIPGSLLVLGRRIRSDLLRALTTADTDLGTRLELSSSQTSFSGSSSRVDFQNDGSGIYDDPPPSHAMILLKTMSRLQSGDITASPIGTLLPALPGTVPFQAHSGTGKPVLSRLRVPKFSVGTGNSDHGLSPLSTVSPMLAPPSLVANGGSSTSGCTIGHSGRCGTPECPGPAHLAYSAHLAPAISISPTPSTNPANLALSTNSTQTPQTPVHTALSSSVALKHPSGALSSFILLDVFDSDARRDSIGGSSEAPQIETKRNVGGDLYLKNQSAWDAFRDIQKTDQRRRGSSLFLSVSRSSSTSAGRKNSRVLDDFRAGLAHASVLGDPRDSVDPMSNSKIKIGPISIEPNRRLSSVISLPLTESFASLDSDNEDYLNMRYHEFRSQKRAQMPDAAAAGDASAESVAEKFNKFSLTHLMSSRKDASHSDACVDGTTDTDDDGPALCIARTSAKSGAKSGPKSVSITGQNSPKASLSSGPLPARNPANAFLSKLSLPSPHSFSSPSQSSDSDDEGGNLTLKFSSKLGPSVRPPYLSLGNRALSHDLQLPKLGKDPLSPVNVYELPFMLQNKMLEYEDVPKGLMAATLAGRASSTANVSRKASNGSSGRENTVAALLNGVGTVVAAQSTKKHSSQSSPLRWEIGQSEGVSPLSARPISTKIGRDSAASVQTPIAPGLFNNHYKKEQSATPLSLGKYHVDEAAKSADERPGHLRSNSVTVAILQNDRANNLAERNEPRQVGNE